MSITRLQDDLLNDFDAQKQMISEQIAVFDPLASQLRKPAAHRLMSKGGLIFAEIFFYSLVLVAIAFLLLMNHIYPFTVLVDVRYIKSIRQLDNITEPEYLSVAIHIIAGFIAVLFYVIARMLRQLRLKNDVLHFAGKNMKILVGQHLKRKAAIEAIEQRHFEELPGLVNHDDVNSVRNAGYDYAE